MSKSTYMYVLECASERVFAGALAICLTHDDCHSQHGEVVVPCDSGEFRTPIVHCYACV